MKWKDALIVSVCIFIIAGMLALLLILNKGHIGSKNLVNTSTVEENEETVKPRLEISVEKEYLSSVSEEEAKLTAVIDGENITEGVEYTSSNKDVIKIEDGKVIAVNDGKATITGLYDGTTDSVEVRVITPIKSITFTSTSSSIRVGKELQMKLQATPTDACIDTLKYTSSNEEIATVNANGIVTGISKGNVTITVKDEYTGIEKSVKLVIK